MVALGEMCYEGMGAVEKGGRRWWQSVNCVWRACGQLKMGSEVVAVGEMSLEGTGAVEKKV